ncbi:dehydrogenase [Shewanella psychropiezotolerans]|uniref:Dehydrogenase n=1 Tax=Shewanella psychropiezotolerans TaxID=2593655 RepID=A0ABX5WXW4_9GAMM|nr:MULTISPECIES: FAD binding domain-containing protein [Shewanella]MPY22395.1 dehydrogenase [Shewanella sp. YLB-07]QDO83282.1 dehydrogenase [Shewanella psychropiezotolerans]
MVNIYRPTKLEQALELNAIYCATLFAGGTDLMVQGMAHYGDSDNAVVFLDDIAEIKGIELDNKTSEPRLVIGAGVTLYELIAHESVPFMIKDAARRIAAPALRNRATLVGNICNASPAADMLPALYLLDARIELGSPGGKRELAIEEFISGPGQTQRLADEIVTKVSLTLPMFDDYLYHKVGTRKANALTKLSILAGVRIESGIIQDWRLTFGAIGPTVVRNVEFEQGLIGQSADVLQQAETIDKIVDFYSQKIAPIDDHRSTAEYRRCAALNLLRRWLENIG